LKHGTISFIKKLYFEITMTDNVHENCGVAAVHIPDGSKFQGMAPNFLYKLLMNLQGRGQLSAGITTYNPLRPRLLETHRDLGLVTEVFKESNPDEQLKIFKSLAGNTGIGHTRYATCGADDRDNAQPLERTHGRRWKWFSFCFNGNIANYSDLKKPLVEKADYHIMFDNDTEIMMHYLSRELQAKSRPDMKEVFSSLAKKFDGAFNIAFINARGTLIVLRDPIGFRPMCYGHYEDVLLVSSESNALANFGVTDIKYLQPGEVLQVLEGKIAIKQLVPSKKQARCMFEWVYFSNVASHFDGKSVYLARTKLGEELAKLETLPINTNEYVVVPVPDSAKPAGDAYAYALGLPSREGLIRNRFAGRTFIEGRSREDKVRNKFTVQKNIIEGKKVLLVDDSIVRGTTTRNIVKYLKEVGKAKEVHIRVSCPPIVAPCFYGIDMSTITELFAPRFKIDPKKPIEKTVLDRMAKELGADSLIYQTIPGLARSISFPQEKLCMACLNTDYPTKQGNLLYGTALKNAMNGQKGRTYEKDKDKGSC